MATQPPPLAKPVSVLFTHFGDDWIRGSERCLLDLLSHLDRRRFHPLVWCNSPAMARAVEALGIRVYRSDFSLLLGWSRPRLDVRAFYRQVRQGIALVDEHRIQLLHANSGAPSQWLNFVARARRIPLLTHLHARYPLRDRITLGLHQASFSVGVSQPVVDNLLQDGIARQRTRLIPNGIDIQRLRSAPCVDLRARLKLQAGDFLLASTGSLIERKGMDLLIRAVERLLAQGVPAHLAVIGDGPERERLVRLAERLGIAGHVHFLGEQANVMGLLKGNADVFVSGAREEVFGLVLAEAGAASLPVVAPRVGGIPEVVEHGVTGLLVEPESPGQIAQALQGLFASPHTRARMGEAGRLRVQQLFTIERNVRQFEALYQQLLHDPGMHAGWLGRWQIARVLWRAIRRVFALSVSSLGREALQ